MKIVLHTLTQAQFDELAAVTSLPLGAGTTVVSNSTQNTMRVSFLLTTHISSLDSTVFGTAGVINDTVTRTLSEANLRSGGKALVGDVSEFSVQQTRIPGFFTGSPLDVITKALGEMNNDRPAPQSFVDQYLTGDDTLEGNGRNNQLNAGAGNDRVIGGGGSDLIDGGAGVDTSVYREQPRSEYLVSRPSTGAVFVATKDGTNDRNVGIERLEFTDTTLDVSSIAYLPGFTSVPGAAVQPVYRFYNTRDKAFFYTNNAAERDMIIRESTDPSFNPANGVWPYFYQGTTFEQAHSSSGSQAVFRFYNTKTGHHFFTTSVAERDLVQKESTDPNFGQPGMWPFVYEGEGFRAFGDRNHKDATPVYRFYSPSLDRHFFTGSSEEAAQVRLTGVWTDEGIGFWGEIAG